MKSILEWMLLTLNGAFFFRNQRAATYLLFNLTFNFLKLSVNVYACKECAIRFRHFNLNKFN